MSPVSGDRVEAGSMLPLAAASQRLRRSPGRPRKSPDTGQVPGTSSAGTRVSTGAANSALVSQTTARLLDLSAAASYLGVSTWTVRDLEATGTLRRVRIPTAGQGELRKLLFDRTDLDRLIDAWKDSA